MGKSSNNKAKRILAFVFDAVFVTLSVFSVYMLLGLIFKLDSNTFQNFVIFLLLIIVIAYLFFGELMFKNTLGKDLFGIKTVDKERLERPSLEDLFKRSLLKILFPIEGLVLLFSKSNKRLGDSWAKTIVVNKETSKLKLSSRLAIGIVLLIALLFSFRILFGFAVKKTDFYNIGINYLKTNSTAKITGLPKVANQTRNTADFIVPISNENHDKYARIYLEKYGNAWSVNHTDFIKEHIIGFSYGYSYSSKKE
jgi:uncharacterized RDD family membrane protein YckC